MGEILHHFDEFGPFRTLLEAHVTMANPSLNPGAITSVMNAAVPVNGTPMTLSRGYVILPHCLALTWSATLASTVLVVGRNQFGDVVSETVTNTGGGEVLVMTNHAYEYVTSITPVTGAWGAVTLKAGFDGSNASPAGKIGLPFRAEFGDVVGISNGNKFIAGVVSLQYHTVTTPTQVGLGTSNNAVLCLHIRRRWQPSGITSQLQNK